MPLTDTGGAAGPGGDTGIGVPIPPGFTPDGYVGAWEADANGKMAWVITPLHIYAPETPASTGGEGESSPGSYIRVGESVDRDVDPNTKPSFDWDWTKDETSRFISLNIAPGKVIARGKSKWFSFDYSRPKKGEEKKWLQWRRRTWKEKGNKRTFTDATVGFHKGNFERSGYLKESIKNGPSQKYMDKTSSWAKFTPEAWEFAIDVVSDWNAFAEKWNPEQVPISADLQRMAVMLWSRWNPATGQDNPFDSITFQRLLQNETIRPEERVEPKAQESTAPVRDIAARPPSLGEMMMNALGTVTTKTFNVGLTSGALQSLNVPINRAKRAVVAKQINPRARIAAWLSSRRKASR
jgi:hypothetical protein